MWRYAEIRTVPDIVRYWAGQAPDRIALVCGERQVTYAELDARSSKIANAILALGAPSGSAVAYVGKNAIEFWEVWFAATKAGGTIAPLNWRSAPAELAELLADARPSIVFVSAEFAGVVSDIRAASAASYDVVTFDPAQERGDGLDLWLAGVDDTDSRVPLTGKETALLAYTSGTTGQSKGVQFTHDAFQNAFLCTALEPSLVWTAQDTVLSVMPSFHLAGSWVTLPALYEGGRVVILPAFDPTEFLAAVQRHRPTVTCLVPAALQMLLDHPKAASTDFSSLRSVLYAGSPISAETLARALDLFGSEFNQFYGATEVWIISLLRPGQHDPGSPHTLTACGSAMPFVDIRILDPVGVDLPDGEVGEIIVRSPVMFAGYWGRPEATAAACPDGWYRTGDLGRRDAEGLLYIVDRSKDMIITGGENVYSVEVERALAQHEAVVSVAVVGAPDEKWGERVVAFVTLRPDASVTEEELRAHCRSLIAGYKVPKAIIIESVLPMTASGKVQKGELRKRFASTRDPLSV